MKKIIVTEHQIKNLIIMISERLATEPSNVPLVVKTNKEPKNPIISAIESLGGKIINEFPVGGNIILQVINFNNKRVYILKNGDLCYGSFIFNNPGFPIKNHSSIVYNSTKAIIVPENAKKQIKLYLNPTNIIYLYGNMNKPMITNKFDSDLKPIIKEIYKNVNGSDKSIGGEDDISYKKFSFLF